MLEHSVSEYDPNHEDPGGRFLQVSGIRVTYAILEPVGNRVKDIKVKVNGIWTSLVPDQEYEVAVLSFMVNGGDGYKMIPDYLVNHKNTGYLDNDLIVSYLGQNSPLQAPEEGRIFITQEVNIGGRIRIMGLAIAIGFAFIYMFN